MKPPYKEHQFQDKYIEMLRTHGAYVNSVVGTFYNAGQPDLDVTSIHGAGIKVELKLYRAINTPSRDAIIALLRGPQINVITKQLWGRNAPCLIIAEIVAVPGTLCIVSKHTMSVDKTENTIKRLAHAPFGTCPYLK